LNLLGCLRYVVNSKSALNLLGYKI